MKLRKIDLSRFRSAFVKAIAIGFPLFVSLVSLKMLGVEQPRSQLLKLDQLAYFQGHWLCQVQDVGTANSALAGNIIWNVVIDRNAKQYDVQGEYVRNREINQKILIRGSMSYDDASDRFVQIASANDGSKFVFSSIGWQADAFSWQGVQTTMEGDYLLRRTITKKDARTFEAIYSGFDPTTSSWQSVTKLLCRK